MEERRYTGAAPLVDWIHVSNKHPEPPKHEWLWVQFEGGLVALANWDGSIWRADGFRVLQYMEVAYWAYIDYPEAV